MGELVLNVRFEYMVLVSRQQNRASTEKVLNELGDQGWELVTVTITPSPISSDHREFFLKRRLRDEPRSSGVNHEQTTHS